VLANPHASRPERGFTLIEIQIALVLLVLIMGLLFVAMHVASKSWKIGQEQNEQIEEKRLVTEFLRRQFSQITPLFWTDTRGSDLIFRGNSDSLLFVGKLPANRNIDELSLLELITRKDQSGTRLELGYGRLSPDQTPFDTRNDRLKHTLVLDQIKEIHFQYFGSQEIGARTSEWSDHWESRKLLPRLIKCQITLVNDEQWPEMLFPVHIDDNSGFRQFILQASKNKQSFRNPPSGNQGQDIEDLF